jgi:hypothetical protein
MFDIWILSSRSNGQNIVQILQKSAAKWSPGRERFHCLILGLDGSIEVAVGVFD